MDDGVVEDMLRRGMLERVSAADLAGFLRGEGLRTLFFTGGDGRSREAHDVAVALRELLKDYGDLMKAGVVDRGDEATLQARFRVLVLPSLVIVLGGEALEVLPGVKDWGVYSAAFRRYLGAPQAVG